MLASTSSTEPENNNNTTVAKNSPNIRTSLAQLCADLDIDLGAAREQARRILNKDKRETGPDGSTLMTVPYIKQLCKEQKLYQSESLNDKLYLHFKGFSKIENLSGYTGLRALWLEGNGITRIENLESCKELRCLYLHQNCIREIENLSELADLDTINLSNNLIKSIPLGSDLAVLHLLKTLQISHNYLENAESLAGLVECPSITILDLSHNKINDVGVYELFEQLPNLAVLNLMGNPVIRQTTNYRRTLVGRLEKLTYLDDRPVFDNERRATQAWLQGGMDAERAERQRIRDEERDEQNRSFDAMRRLQEEAHLQRLAADPNALAEPRFSEPLQRFRDQMLQRIEDPVAEEISSNSPTDEQRMQDGDVEVQEIDMSGRQALRGVVMTNLRQIGHIDEEDGRPEPGGGSDDDPGESEVEDALSSVSADHGEEQTQSDPQQLLLSEMASDVNELNREHSDGVHEEETAARILSAVERRRQRLQISNADSDDEEEAVQLEACAQTTDQALLGSNDEESEEEDIESVYLPPDDFPANRPVVTIGGRIFAPPPAPFSDSSSTIQEHSSSTFDTVTLGASSEVEEDADLESARENA